MNGWRRGIDIYPVPFGDELKILVSVNGWAYAEIELFNAIGQKILENTVVVNGAREVVVNTEGFAGGVYFVRVKAGDVEGSERVLRVRD